VLVLGHAMNLGWTCGCHFSPSEGGNNMRVCIRVCIRVCTLPALVLAVIASGTSEPSAWAQDKRPEAVKVTEKVRKDLGDRAVGILLDATRVEVFRLAKLPGEKLKPPSVGADKLQFSITAAGKEKGKEFAAKVRRFVFDEATRTLSGASGFRGDVAFRL